ncbi:hypothetical protein ABZW10_18845 [Kitasatospora sp. NPDC004723]|uniref:hypothetical protein n=1 Tax=Kitasatospora sp. NPDC004723 TaxID=3154288 RepID=UPI00339DA907
MFENQPSARAGPTAFLTGLTDSEGAAVSRRLRYIGSNSGKDGYPTLYGDVETGEVLVQGEAVTDPDEVAQLPTVGREPVLIGFDEFDGMFENFEHTAFRPRTPGCSTRASSPCCTSTPTTT